MEDGVEGPTLQEWRSTHVQNCWHALLNHRGSHGRCCLQDLASNLDAQLCYVEVCVGDKRNDITHNLHARLWGHVRTILPHQVHKRIQALLPEGTAVLRQVSRQMRANWTEDRLQCINLHLGNAHGLQRFDCNGSSNLVLDTLYKWWQTALQCSLECWQITNTSHEMAEALQCALLDLLVNVSSHELSAKHLKNRQHLHKLIARRPWGRPQWVDVYTNSLERLCN
mmetsp:Transcript_66134/g.122035  ORF Transcript_66134/g.122035 Transcript_66134/m.122035 type:complete len:225 (-) Transcript_66134:156-830(-)